MLVSHLLLETAFETWTINVSFMYTFHFVQLPILLQKPFTLTLRGIFTTFLQYPTHETSFLVFYCTNLKLYNNLLCSIKIEESITKYWYEQRSFKIRISISYTLILILLKYVKVPGFFIRVGNWHHKSIVCFVFVLICFYCKEWHWHHKVFFHSTCIFY